MKIRVCAVIGTPGFSAASPRPLHLHPHMYGNPQASHMAQPAHREPHGTPPPMFVLAGFWLSQKWLFTWGTTPHSSVRDKIGLVRV